jgi:cell division septation protein DedD
MRNNETGEIELVVGNRQLLSGFFIVVLLCAVAFAMGYVVGQNSPHSAKVGDPASSGVVAVNPADTRPMPASPATPVAPPTQPSASGETPPPTGAGSEVGGAAATPPNDPPAPTTRPARDVEPPPATPPAPAPAAEAGSYWQVSAIANQDAVAAMQQTLKDAGFPVVLGPGPNNLTRVLVGPYSDTAAMARAKTALEKAGFHPVKK